MEEKDSCCILDRYKAVSRSSDLVTHYDSMHKDIFDTMIHDFSCKRFYDILVVCIRRLCSNDLTPIHREINLQ